jgi:diaminobutyrate-2-oxoglutarate transaminase
MLIEQEEAESRAISYPRGLPIAFEAGRGATLRDVDGNIYIDFFAGAGVLNLGHGNPVVIAAAARQQGKLIHALDFPTPARARLTRILRAVLPDTLPRTGRIHFGGPTGSDAVEAAVKLAQAHTGRKGLIAFQGSYHGMTGTALAISANAGLHGQSSGSVHFLPYPYPYRSPLGLDEALTSRACISLMETCLSDPLSGIAKPAAVIIEPIQGEGGTIVPPKGFLKELRRVTQEHDVLLIMDEIQTGFGRTGAMFACEHEEVCPDIMIMSKALGGVGFPISCIAYHQHLDSWQPGAHIGTFRGHQVAMAAGAAAIEYIIDADLAQRTATMGELALDLLRSSAETLPAIGDIRGRGLFIGVELVRNQKTKEPWPKLAHLLRRECANRGLIVEIGGHFSNVVRFLPALTIPRELLERGLGIFADALYELEDSADRTEDSRP